MLPHKYFRINNKILECALPKKHRSHDFARTGHLKRNEGNENHRIKSILLDEMEVMSKFENHCPTSIAQ